MSTAGPGDGGGRHRSTRRVLASLLVTLALAGCTGGRPAQDRLTVLAASSLVDVVADLADGWGVLPVDVIDAGSQVLAAQVRAGAPADVLLLADPTIAAALADEGNAGPPVEVAGNALALVTPADRPLPDVGVLEDPALRVVLADAGVPLGDATRQALAADADVDGAAVLDGADSLEDAARLVLAKVTAGEADAAVVYVTDALAAGSRVAVVPWPAGAATTTRVTAQTVRTSDDAGIDAGPAASFVAYLAGDAARATWSAAGFTPPAA